MGAPPAMAYFVEDATLFLLKHWREEKTSAEVADAELFLVAEIRSNYLLWKFLRHVEYAPLEKSEDLPGSELVDLLLQLDRSLWDTECIICAVLTLASFRDGDRHCLRLLPQLLCYGHRPRDFHYYDLVRIFETCVKHCLACVQFFPVRCVMENRKALEAACLQLGSRWDVRAAGCFAQMLPEKLLNDRRFVLSFMSRVRDDGLSLQRPVLSPKRVWKFCECFFEILFSRGATSNAIVKWCRSSCSTTSACS